MDEKQLYFYKFRKEWIEICNKLKNSGADLSKIKIAQEGIGVKKNG